MSCVDLGRRVAAALESLRSSGLDAMLLTPGADMLYLTGFTHGHANRRLLAYILKRDGSAAWITPAMNELPLRETVGSGAPIRAWGDGEGYLPALADALGQVGSVAFDDEARSAFLMDLLAVNPSVRVTRTSEVMTPLRIRKSQDEMAALRAAGATVDATIPDAISFCQPGRSEAEVDELLRAALVRRSPESAVGFSIIASGPNGALPHHDTGRRVLQRGDAVILDYGTVLNSYLSDITVTCSVGEPSDPDVRKVYGIVWEAQQRAIEAIRPGATTGQIDAAARGVIDAAGYGDYFLHRTGHGLGLQIHEPPFIVPGTADVLEEGMVFSIEPGIYLAGRFGVRLEVIASVAADGCSLINAPRVRDLPLVEI